MDMQPLMLWLFGAAITILIAIIGAMFKAKNDAHKSMWDAIRAGDEKTDSAIKATEEKLQNFRVEVAREYVTMARFERAEGNILHALNELNANVMELSRSIHKNG